VGYQLRLQSSSIRVNTIIWLLRHNRLKVNSEQVINLYNMNCLPHLFIKSLLQLVLGEL